MSLYQDIDELIKQGAVPTDRLPAHILFGHNAADIAAPARPDETASEMEMRVAAGNAAGMADGYYSGTQILDEDGNTTTKEEKEEKNRQKLRSKGLAISTSVITSNLEFYDSSKESALAAHNYWQERQQNLLNEKADLESQLDNINSNNNGCRQAVADSSQAMVDAQAAHEEDQTNLQRLQDNIANGNEALKDGKMLGANDGRVYDIVATQDGAMAISQDDDGTFIMLAYDDPSIIKDPMQIREIVRFSEMALPEAIKKEAVSAEEADQAREAYAYYVKDMEETYNATVPITDQIKTRLAEVETGLTEAGNNLDLLSKYNDPEFRARLEDGSETISPEVRDILNAQRLRDGLEPLPAPGEESAAEVGGESLWDSIWNTASGTIQSLTDSITGYEQEQEKLTADLSQMEENQKYLTGRIDYLKSEDVAQRMDTGKLSINEIESATYAYDPSYWDDFHDRHQQSTPVETSPIAQNPFQSGGVKQSVMNMSVAQGYIGEDGIFIPYDHYGIDANIPAAQGAMSMASTDGLGISTSINAQSAFTSAANGQVYQSTVSPDKLAELRASLSPDTQPVQVAQNNTAALAL